MSDQVGSEPKFRYNAKMAGELEAKWQKIWAEQGSFYADNPVGNLAGTRAQKDPWFVMDMFPYPSGKGLHVGHPLGYIATDTMARYMRMRGKNVLYTLGYDAFGLPAEQYAIQTGQHPRITTEDAIENMRGQLARLGLSHDPRRSIETIDEDYVRWTQWIFLQIFNSWYDPEKPNREGTKGCARPISELIAEFAAGTRPTPTGENWNELDETVQAKILDEYRLAYLSESPVNWAPGLGTVLANEEVTADGRSERGNFPVFTRNLRQWNMRITAYADRLLEGLEGLDWPDKVRSMQRHWIGKSRGATVTFQVVAEEEAGCEATAENTAVAPSSRGTANPPVTSSAMTDSISSNAAATGATMGAPKMDSLKVFTTRPDTLFGATFMVVSPEHPLLDEAPPAQWPAATRAAWTGEYATPGEAIAAYRKRAASRTAVERQADAGEKTGVFTGWFGVNPMNDQLVPIFTADYVLMGYGTGAIMAVPAHDERDFAFAKKFDLDIIPTIEPTEADGAPTDFDNQESAWTGDGIIVNSERADFSINGLRKQEAIDKVLAWLTTQGVGEETITYRLRDWLFSRQRYWGEPFPIVYDENGIAHPLPEDQLPVKLPELDDFSPRTFEPDDAESNPETPLTRASDWTHVTLDLGDGKGARNYVRDTNTMPNWAGSCYYELRYVDPDNSEQLVAPENDAYWMGVREGKVSGGVDLYVGGVEHAVLHLLYSRFWQKILFDLGVVSSPEPFHKLFNQGYVQAYAYTDERGVYVPASEVEGDEKSGFTWRGQPVQREYGKMGKSLKNVVTPDEMCETYGADTFRVFEMAMGPLDISRPWETRTVVGSYRFLQRLWRNIVDEETGQVTVTDEPADLETKKLVAKTIAVVTEEFTHMRINTGIARLIVLNNHLTQMPQVPREAIEPLVLMIAPVAPHIAEELWQKLGHEGTLVHADFPVVTDESLLEEELITCVVQVNGKVRARLEVPVNISEQDLEQQALAEPGIQKMLGGEKPLKVIVRAPKLVNVVVPKQ